MICTTLFNGYGLGLFGALHRYQLYFVVLGVWAAHGVQPDLVPLFLVRTGRMGLARSPIGNSSPARPAGGADAGNDGTATATRWRPARRAPVVSHAEPSEGVGHGSGRPTPLGPAAQRAAPLPPWPPPRFCCGERSSRTFIIRRLLGHLASSLPGRGWSGTRMHAKGRHGLGGGARRPRPR